MPSRQTRRDVGSEPLRTTRTTYTRTSDNVSSVNTSESTYIYVRLSLLEDKHPVGALEARRGTANKGGRAARPVDCVAGKFLLILLRLLID